MNKFFIFFCTTFFILIQLTSADPSYNQLLQNANQEYENIVKARRYIHQHAELGFNEFQTSEMIQSVLKEHNISFTSGWGVDTNTSQPTKGTGIIAEVGTGHSPCVAMRADFDALPIFELADVPFKSQNEGVMHACGHDSHAAMLLGSAIILKKYESQLPGTIKFFFQPAEEGGGGALMMVNEGALTKYPPVEKISGMHINHAFPTGHISSRPGTIQAGVFSFKIFIRGVGGHAAFHHEAIDPLTASTAIVRTLYDVYSRELYFNHDKAGVISITYLDSGSTATNVIPTEVEIGGTLRALTLDTLKYLKKRLYEVVESTAHAFKCSSEIVQTTTSYPPTLNDPDYFEFLKKTANEAGVGPVTQVEPHMGAEDFSFYANEVPAVFFRIGSGSASEIPGHPASNVSTHNAKFVLDERVLPLGTSFHSFLAVKMLESLKSQSAV